MRVLWEKDEFKVSRWRNVGVESGGGEGEDGGEGGGGGGGCRGNMGGGSEGRRMNKSDLDSNAL